MTSATWWLELIIDLYFVTDIVVNFRTAYFDDHGNLICAPWDIAMHYANPLAARGSCNGKAVWVSWLAGSWFLLDVFSCLPFNYVSMDVAHGANSNLYMPPDDVPTDGAAEAGQDATGSFKAAKILRLLRLAKMLRMFRLARMLERYEDSDFHDVLMAYKMLGMGVLILYISHIFACGWYFVGEEAAVDAHGNHIPGWVESMASGRTSGAARLSPCRFPADITRSS